jgi:CspA family cold shock protein
MRRGRRLETPITLESEDASIDSSVEVCKSVRVSLYCWHSRFSLPGDLPPSGPSPRTPNPDRGLRKWLCGSADALVRSFKEIKMASGTVKFFNSQKGFGFIQQDGGGPDVFVHVSAVERAGMRGLAEGQKLQFDIEADRKSGKSAATNLQTA